MMLCLFVYLCLYFGLLFYWVVVLLLKLHNGEKISVENLSFCDTLRHC